MKRRDAGSVQQANLWTDLQVLSLTSGLFWKPLVPQQYGLAVVVAITLVDYSHIISSATPDYVVTAASLYPISTTTRL